jgi:hypothetical protein
VAASAKRMGKLPETTRRMVHAVGERMANARGEPYKDALNGARKYVVLNQRTTQDRFLVQTGRSH